MSKLISLLRKNNGQEHSTLASTGAFPSPVPSLHRKIHPNLDSLVSGLQDQHSVVSHDSTLPSDLLGGADFIPLKPKPPMQGRANSASLHLDPAMVLELQGPREGDNRIIATECASPSATGDAWPTFGRGLMPPLRTTLEDVEILTSRGELTCRYMHLQTPTSMSRSSDASSPRSQSTQHNRNSPSSHNDIVSTPHTLDRRSSPASYYTFGKRPSSSNICAETPPPLPPLDHPAFQSVIRTQKSFKSSSEAACKDELGKNPRHSASLPSMLSPGPERQRIVSGTSESIRGARKRHYELQVDGNREMAIFRPVYHNPQKLITKSRRTRSESKSSHGSRHSSTGYSPRDEVLAKEEESWEAEVLCDQEPAVGKTTPEKACDVSNLGNNSACGDNVQPCGRALRLGDPFLLQSVCSCLVPQSSRHANEFPFIHDITRLKNGEGEAHEMSQPDANTHHSNRQGRAGQSNTDSQSRSKTVSRGQESSPPKQGHASLSAAEPLLVPPYLSLTSPTPETSPILPLQEASSSGSNLPSAPRSVLRSSIRRTTGKRKAEEAEVEAATPSKDSRKEHRATFAPEQRPHRISEHSGSSHAPSSYHHRKRARLSTSSESGPLSPTFTSVGENLGAPPTGSWSSRGSKGRPVVTPHHYSSSRQSMQSQRPSYSFPFQRSGREPSRRRSLSGASIPISALVSPHAPSISRSLTFHMHDPKRPAPIQRTSWALSLPAPAVGVGRWTLAGWVERGGSPIHAWLFFLGFIVFPVWWLAAFIGIPKTRRIGEGGEEKGVILDDPQVEHDSKSWRTRCRVMAVISFFTYIPFIILVAIFARH